MWLEQDPVREYFISCWVLDKFRDSGSFCVDPRSPASNLSFWLCVYIYKAQPKLIWLLTCGEDKCRVVDFIVTWVLRLIKRDDGDFGFNGIVFDDDKK